MARSTAARPATSARFVQRIIGDLLAEIHARSFELHLFRLSRRASPGAAHIHASHFGNGRSRCAAWPSLAGLVSRHIWCCHRRAGLAHRENRGQR
ncbi:MAG: hypothetical protein DME40_06410, partial [Verrucomicrobia bacterium]